MMKKLLIIGILVLALMFSGCSVKVTTETNDAGASVPEGFELISETTDITYKNVYEVRHIETGCHYILSQETGITPMVYNEAGKMLTYCTE